MQASPHRARAIGMALLGIFRQLDAEAGSVGDDQKTVFELEVTLDDFALWRLGFPLRVLLESEVGNAGGELQAGGGADRAERIVRHHADVMGFCERRDLLTV